jgi:hypothetical protein
MVPLSDRDAVTRAAKVDSEMRAIYALVFGETFDFAGDRSFPKWALLHAVTDRDQTAFLAQVAEFKSRKTSATSGWYDNDCLIFLLLLGCEQFGCDRTFLDPIMVARDRNTNPTPKRVNEIFRALRRSEHGMDGEFAFIKVTFLHLAKPLTISPQDAEKVYQELTRPGLLAELSPFLQLLALRAFDLILFQRRPTKFENFNELINSLETYREKASVRQALQILWAVPYKWLLAAVSVVLLAISVFVGWSQHYFERLNAMQGQRPASLQTMAASDALQSDISLVRALAQQSMPRAIAGEHWSAVAFESSRFADASPKFSIEVSTQAGTILESHAFVVSEVDGGLAKTIVPLQTGPHSIRSFLPPAKAGSYVVFILIIKTDAPITPAKLVSTVSLRSLD